MNVELDFSPTGVYSIKESRMLFLKQMVSHFPELVAEDFPFLLSWSKAKDTVMVFGLGMHIHRVTELSL